MLKPLKLSLKNFKCFQECEFIFPSKPGLYFVTGKNQVFEDLEGNATGKSTLFCDAVCWCLYGKTPRGLFASQIIQWQQTNSQVYFEFEWGGTVVGVLRTQSPNQLVKIEQGMKKTISQEELVDWLRLDYTAFCASIVFSQMVDFFFDLGASEKSEMLESVLPLEIWEQCTLMAKDQTNQQQNQLNELQRQFAEQSGYLDAMDSFDLETEIEEWEKEKQLDLQELQESLQDREKQLVVLKTQGSEAEQHLERVSGQVEETEQLLQEIIQDYTKIRDQAIHLESEAGFLMTSIKSYQQKIQRIKEFGPVCNTCFQGIGEEHKEREIKKVVQEMALKNEEISKKKREREAFSDQLKELSFVQNETQGIYNYVMKEKTALQSKIRELKIVANQALQHIQQLKGQIKKREERPNLLIERKKEQETQRLRAQQILDELKVQIPKQELFVSQLKYWVKGFKSIKLMVIQQLLTQLELEVANYLFQFGLKDWTVQFAVENQTKAGKTKKGFSVFIQPPASQQQIPWKAYSGGETQRLRLAGAMGFSDLIQSCLGTSFGWEVWDEPSNYISPKGISQLVELLRDRAIQKNRVIFLIDQRHLDTTAFEKVYTVMKSVQGSEVVS